LPIEVVEPNSVVVAEVEAPPPPAIGSFDAAEDKAPAVEPRFAAAVRSLVESPVVRAPASKTKIRPRSAIFTDAQRKPLNSGNGRFVVQLGAFSSPALVEKAWAQAQRRYAFVANSQPLSTSVTIAGKGKLYRLAVAGFGSRSEASELCGEIKARSGVCFVRTFAGDAPVQWASRGTPRRG
jgi:cell division septation protein DedD